MNVDEYIKYFTVYDYSDKIRLGNKCDGGYVIANNIGNYDCYISAGIGGDESFSRDFLQMYKVDNAGAFQLDIEKLPINFPKNMVFYKRNISNISDMNNANLQFFIKKYNNIFLKMDIEGDEFLWLDSLSSEDLNKFKQITCEFHGILDDSFYDLNTKSRCFKKLYDTHYLVHAHGNNYAPTIKINNKEFPTVIELTYVRKCDMGILSVNKNQLPCLLDYKCNDNLPYDIELNFEPFVN
jgi:hypothetical protein